MRVIKTAAILLLTVFAVCSFCSCSRIMGLLPKEDPDRTVSYTNEDYHFTLTHPAYFSKTEIKESEENGDEINIKLIASDDDLIDIDIRYKNENGESSPSLYGYITRNGFDKDRIIPLTTNSFAYDDREGEAAAYFIYAATKRMIYVISYSHKENNEKEQLVIDSLNFSFDSYANLPKNNAFLSDQIKFAGNLFKLRFLAESEAGFDVEPYRNEDGTANYMFCRMITVSSRYCKAVFNVPMAQRYQYLEYDKIDIEADAETVISEICPGFEDIVYGESDDRTNGTIIYKIITFYCKYNGKTAVGSLTVGFNGLSYFEYVSVICEDATDAELRNYTDMIASFCI